MSCQVCHRMICRCGPDVTEALRAQNELHEQIYLLQQRLANSETKISALNSTLESALIAFERIAIGNAFCNPRETAMLMYNEIKQRLSCEETPERKGPDLTGIERECCGTFHGTPHRSTCKNFNTKTRKLDPFYEDGGSGHDLAI